MTLKDTVLAATLSVLVPALAGGQAVTTRDTTDANPSTLEWFAANGSAINGIDPSNQSGDLRRWNELTANARIIGLGEQTHGGSEISRLKTRLVAHGILAQNVTVIGLENAPGPVLPINRFLHGGDANLDSLMQGLSRLWRTEEVRSMFLWVRDHNARQRRASAPEVDLVGIDVQGGITRDSMMAETIVAEMTRRPSASRAVIWAHNVHVAYLKDRIGPELRRMIGTGYVALGTAAATGTYRAHAPMDSGGRQSDGHVVPPSGVGSAELSFVRISERVGGVAQFYDLRRIIADPRGHWLDMPRDFHHLGTNVSDVGVQVQNVGRMFDLLVVIPKITSAHSIVGIQ